MLVRRSIVYTVRVETNVRTWGCLGGIGTREFVQQPVRGRTETLLMFLRTATHLELLFVEG